MLIKNILISISFTVCGYGRLGFAIRCESNSLPMDDVRQGKSRKVFPVFCAATLPNQFVQQLSLHARESSSRMMCQTIDILTTSISRVTMLMAIIGPDNTINTTGNMKSQY